MAGEMEEFVRKFLLGLEMGFWAMVNAIAHVVGLLHDYLEQLRAARSVPPKVVTQDVNVVDGTVKSMGVEKIEEVDVDSGRCEGHQVSRKEAKQSEGVSIEEKSEGASRNFEFWLGETPYNCDLGLPPRKQKWYAVAAGRHTGLFNSWKEARALVDGYSGSTYRSFTSPYAGELWLRNESPL